MTLLELAWLAGFLEGEGSFCVYIQKDRGRKQCHVSFNTTDKDVADHAALIMDCNVNGPYKTSGPSHYGKKPRYAGAIAGKRAQALAEQLLPFMGDRRAAKIREMLAIQVAQFPNLERDPLTGRTVNVAL